jgi:hypothetical protein
MSGKFNNRMLLVVFLILAAIFLITRFTSLGKSDRTLVTDITEIDTSQVSSILLYPKAEKGTMLEFRRKGALWTVSREDLTVAADARSVMSTLGELMNLKTDQLVARSRESWPEYAVDDSLGSRVIVKEGKKTALDLVVGRFQYQPPPQNQYNPYGQSSGTGKTYIRLSGEKEVYATDGYLAMSINQDFNRWRDQRVTQLNRARVSKIIFDYPADSGFVAERNDAGWMVAGIMADSASMAGYLNRVSRKTLREYADGFQPAGDPDFRVSFEGDNMSPQQVRAYKQEGDKVVLNSSINPDTWFRTGRSGVFSDLFPGSEKLLSGGK